MKAKKINILLVDANQKFLNSIAERSRLKGFNVFTASSGKQAIEIAQKQSIHVAVVDQRMPDMDGLVQSPRANLQRAKEIQDVLLLARPEPVEVVDDSIRF